MPLTVFSYLHSVYPYLCQALANVVKDRAKGNTDKEYYVSLIDVPTRSKVRELKSSQVGTLIRISGQVVRTHPVHPELVSGVFKCLECQTVIPNVEQQFKVMNAFVLINLNLCTSYIKATFIYSSLYQPYVVILYVIIEDVSTWILINQFSLIFKK